MGLQGKVVGLAIMLAAASVVGAGQGAHARGTAVPVTVLLQVGDVPTGGGGHPVLDVRQPTTNGSGVPAFTGSLDTTDPDEFVWQGDGISWLSSTSGLDTDSIEVVMGHADDGTFIASLEIDPGTRDAVLTADTVLLAKDDPAPGLPGNFITYCSRPMMTRGGAAYWVSGYADIQGGLTDARALYRVADTTAPSAEIVIRSGSVVGGYAIHDDFDNDYFISDNGAHHIHVLPTTEAVDRTIVYLDGAVILRQGEATGDGDGWESFDAVQVNDSGDWLMSGDTDGSGAADEFIAHNGSIVLREGDTLDGIVLTSPASVRAAAINNAGEAVFAWRVADGTIILFFAPDAADPTDAVAVIATGDQVDVDGDETADAVLTGFDTYWHLLGSHSIALAEDGRLYLECYLDYGAGDVNAVIGLSLRDGLFGDGFESGTTGAWSSVSPGY